MLFDYCPIGHDTRSRDKFQTTIFHGKEHRAFDFILRNHQNINKKFAILIRYYLNKLSLTDGNCSDRKTTLYRVFNISRRTRTNRFSVVICRRKKKCIRYMGEGGDGDGEADGEAEDDHSEDNLGSVGEAGTPEEDESLSSPGGLSALSSLASPSLVLPSPSSLASPCPCPLTPPVPPPPLSNTNQPVAATTTTTTVAAAAAAAAAMAMAGSAMTSAAVQQQQQQQQQQPQPLPQPHRNPVGTNPHDINNPLSVNQLTGQCIKSEPAPSGPSNPAISVT